MNPAFKMLAMTSRNNERDRYNRGGSGGNNMTYGGYGTEYEGRDYTRNEYNGSDMNYGGVEGRFRDRRGREHYDNGRYAPMRNEAYETEMNYGEKNGTTSHYPLTPYESPMYRPEYREEYHPMRKIGFATDDETGGNYRSEVSHPHMNHMEHKTSEAAMGHASARGDKLTREMAEEWLANIENEDGTTGPHWTMEQAKQVMAQKGVQGDPVEFWVALNMMYSDYCKVAKKVAANNIDFYVEMAKAFLDDKDAAPHKLGMYYEYVVKK